MNISSKKELDAAIIELEKRKVIQESLLTSQFKVTYESVRPSTLIKNLFSKLSQSPEVRGGVLKTVTGMAVGIITKRIFIGKSASLLGKLVSTALELGVAKTAISNTDKVKAYGLAIYQNLFRKKSNKPKQLIL